MKKNVKNKLNQLSIKIIIIIILFLIGYITTQNQSKLPENTLNKSIQTNTINNNTNINIDDIPLYSGKIVIDINNDIPYFEDKDISTENFEYYSNLDELDRAGTAFANICKFTMPKERNKKK